MVMDTSKPVKNATAVLISTKLELLVFPRLLIRVCFIFLKIFQSVLKQNDPCCDSRTCRFNPGAKCSNVNGQGETNVCCKSCQIVSASANVVSKFVSL